MRWVYRILVMLLGAAILSAAVLSSRGSFQRVRAPGQDATISAAALWRTCLSRQPRLDRTLVDRCVRVRGTLLHAWQKHHDEGTLQEVHLLLASHFRLYVVKVPPPCPPKLSIGHAAPA